MTELFENDAVRQWLANLKMYDTLYGEAQQGLGLGAGGNSSFLHGSTDMNFEVVLPKLAQLGLRSGLADWIRRLSPGLTFSKPR